MTTIKELNTPFNDSIIVSVTKIGSNFLTLSKSKKEADVVTSEVSNVNNTA